MDPHENNNTRAQYMHGLDTHSLIWVEIHSNEKCPSLKRHVTHPPLSLLIVDTSRRQEQAEVNGKEYYFITKSHFKEYVSNGKFVEHGEYSGHFYGTSLDAIKEIIDSGKVCVVNLHCQVRKTFIASLSDDITYQQDVNINFRY